MSDPTIPLSVVSSVYSPSHWLQIAIGKNVMQPQPPPTTQGYWFVVLDRRTLQVVFNQFQASGNVAPNIGGFNTTDYMLVVSTTGVGLNNQPQGDLFKFLDLNGAGRQLRHIDQIAAQFNCGSLGTFGYALVSVLGNLNQPGFELSQISNPNTGPFLTVQLMSTVIAGVTYYTPIELSNA